MSSRTARRRSSLLAVLLAVVAALVLPAPAPRVDAQGGAIHKRGELGGAPYFMTVPPNWRGGLVVFAHGIQRGIGPGDAVSPSPATHILGEGHALIASGYREREYRPDVAVEDSIALRELFLKEFGRPRWSMIYGQSMGGHIVVASLELHPACTRAVSRSAAWSTVSASPTT